MVEGLRPRLRLMLAVLVALTLVIVAQLVNVQAVNHRFYRDWASEQQNRQIASTNPPRGVIRDRNGFLLAGNAVEYAIEAAPVHVVNTSTVASALGSILHMPSGNIKQKIEGDDVWVSLAAPVTKEVGESVAELGYFGISVRPLWRREYPEGGLGAHLTGFCNVAGQGYYGVEGFYDASLRPVTAAVKTFVDVLSEPVPWSRMPITMPHPGDELFLTIDRDVQALAEQELARSLEEFEAEAGTIIVMDPRTFELLAVASLPSYDPGSYLDYLNMDHPPFEDPSVSKQYEPGSVFKILTVAAAIDMGLVSPDTVYDDQGWIEVGGRVIRNATRRAYGQQTVSDLLVKSLNVGAAWLSTQMGPDGFYRYLQAFGIGRLTGVDLASEVPGQLWLPGDLQHYHDSNLGTNAFGQGLAVTPMQMIAAIATIANDGTRLRPHVGARRISHDGSLSHHEEVTEAQVVSAETARLVTEMMVRVVDEGVVEAQVPGYRVAGKTGTAQIPIPGGYDPEGTIASFVGFGPVPGPQLVILVRLDRPKTSPWGSQTAAASFSRLASRLFIVLGIPPQDAYLAEAVQ